MFNSHEHITYSMIQCSPQITTTRKTKRRILFIYSYTGSVTCNARSWEL